MGLQVAVGLRQWGNELQWACGRGYSGPVAVVFRVTVACGSGITACGTSYSGPVAVGLRVTVGL